MIIQSSKLGCIKKTIAAAKTKRPCICKGHLDSVVNAFFKRRGALIAQQKGEDDDITLTLTGLPLGV